MALGWKHEIAHHSYAHTDPSEQTPDEERRDMERALESLAKTGVTPLDYSDLTFERMGMVAQQLTLSSTP